MREVVASGAAAPPDGFVEAVTTCVQCRGCETACPSGVPFGRLIEGTRSTLARDHRTVPWWERWAYRTLGRGRLLRAATVAAGAVPAVRRRLGWPRPPARRSPLRPSGTDVVVFTGCVMDALQREVHIATQRVLEEAGFGVTFAGGCCGALAHHAGLDATAARQAHGVLRVCEQRAPGVPVLVNAAGCGAQLKDVDRLLGTASAGAFAGRVYDVHEWLAREVDRLPPPVRSAGRVAIQDPCHLRHVQRAEAGVRTVLGRYYELVELDDEGLCCGAGGAFSLFEPDLAGAIRSRKLEAIARAHAPVVASANPGCAFHLAAAGVAVHHPMELVAEAIGVSSGRSPRR
jgi:glycolate oxidase iron-sulfur subunit